MTICREIWRSGGDGVSRRWNFDSFLLFVEWEVDMRESWIAILFEKMKSLNKRDLSVSVANSVKVDGSENMSSLPPVNVQVVPSFSSEHGANHPGSSFYRIWWRG